MLSEEIEAAAEIRIEKKTKEAQVLKHELEREMELHDIKVVVVDTPEKITCEIDAQCELL